MRTSPIALLVYNRPGHTKRVIQALENNELAKYSELYIFSDGAKQIEDIEKVNAVRKLVSKPFRFKKVAVIEREQNLGLAENMIESISRLLDSNDSVIVLEDDDVTSPQFLNYMNYLLNQYRSENKIHSISAFSLPNNLLKTPRSYEYDVFFSTRASSWGWGTWSNRWKNVDWTIEDYEEFIHNSKMKKQFELGGLDLIEMLKDWKNGLNNSWSIRWCYAHYKNEAYCVHPVMSYVQNIGHDGTGVHCGVSSKFNQKELNAINTPKTPPVITPNSQISKNFVKVYNGNLISRFKKYVKNYEM